MDLSICSYSFHRLLATGKQDIFQYIIDCKRLGCTYLDPWNAHLPLLKEGDAKAGIDPNFTDLTDGEEEYLDEVKAAADELHMPFGCIAVDGAHIYEADPAAREANRIRANRWVSAAALLGARQVRIDSGGTPEMPDDEFRIIVSGYEELLQWAENQGIEVLIENHWGPSPIPENLIKILEAVDGLGLLFDTNNWAPGMQHKGWEMCAPYARLTHIKTFEFDESGNEPSVDIPRAMRHLIDAGYTGAWGIESCPRDGDEMEGARKTVALIKRVLSEQDGGRA